MPAPRPGHFLLKSGCCFFSPLSGGLGSTQHTKDILLGCLFETGSFFLLPRLALNLESYCLSYPDLVSSKFLNLPPLLATCSF